MQGLRSVQLAVMVLALVVAVLGAACGAAATPIPTATPTKAPPTATATPAPTPTPAPFQVTIMDFALPNITIPVGTAFMWRNDDLYTHTVTSGKDGQFDGAGWDSPVLPTGQTFSSVNSAGEGYHPQNARCCKGAGVCVDYIST